MPITRNSALALCIFNLLSASVDASYLADGCQVSPVEWQLQQVDKQLLSDDAWSRAGALEQIGFMRAYDRAEKVADFIDDEDPVVRREAVMVLGWIGDRDSAFPLVMALDDPDWTVRQAASISLQNLCGEAFPYDALARPGVRDSQAKEWAQGVEGTDLSAVVIDALADASLDYFEKADRVRAAGTYKCSDIVGPLIHVLEPYLTAPYPKDNNSRLYSAASPAVDARPERAFVQAGLRALGRIGGNEAEAFLIKMLHANPDWACYAAEALGDCGGGKAVAALIAAYPGHAFALDRPTYFSNYDKVVPDAPDHDKPRLSATDRIPRAAYAILLSLSRLDLSAHKDELRAISPYILSTVPNQWDATVVYMEEPWAMVYGYLLEQAGVRRLAATAALEALNAEGHKLPDSFGMKDEFLHQASFNANRPESQHAPNAGLILLCSASKQDIPALLDLLDHSDGWIKIDAAKTLALLDAKNAIPLLVQALESARDDADYGYDMDFRRFHAYNYIPDKQMPGEGYDELSNPSPRHKEAFLRALGMLGAEESIPLLIQHLNNDRNAIEIQYAAAQALADLATPEALDALYIAEYSHPVSQVMILAREAMWRHGRNPKLVEPQEKLRMVQQLPVPEGNPQSIAFIKGDREVGNNMQISKDLTAYSTTDAGPTYRMGRNIFAFDTTDPDKSLRQLTHFESGYVADLEVSYDGKRLLFSHNTLAPEPWFHVYEMNADGSGLKQLTFGPYHDLHPNYMPDGRIVFSSSRTGLRDEYHGYPANALAVMNADGSDIHIIGYNLGRDAEPVVGDDGKILFTRLELFYSRMKTEWNLLTVYPDGRMPTTLYGPERRELHGNIGGADAIARPRHRGVRITQPQSWDKSTYLLNTFKGPMIAGPGRYTERFLMPDNTWAVTTPVQLPDGRLLVAAGKRPYSEKDGFPKKESKKGDLDIISSVDHGIYYLDTKTGELELVYNDPDFADFEARPLQPRKVPPVLPESPLTRSRAFSGTLYCSSAFITQDPWVKERGKYIRVIEALPALARHQTHANGGIAWRNHGGPSSRVLGTVPLAADGSFALELPSDRLFHLQVLDSDRRVMGNELIWQYVRPKEFKSCVGCHENPDDAPSMTTFPQAQKMPPVKCFPTGGEFQYRAKMWFKGWAPDEREERMRTVNSINIIGRQ